MSFAYGSRPRVYVSSTRRDLKDCRDAVRDVLHRLGCEAIAMEAYVAEHHPPLHRCLSDVAECDLYVVIVG